MRTYIYGALAVVSFGLLTLAPANANGQWSCIGPAVACDSAPAASTYNYRSGDGYIGERANRRQATSKRSRNRVAKHVEPSPRVAKNVERNVERKEQAKIDLPERKQASTEHKEAATEPKTTTQPAHRTTSAKSQSGMASYYGTESGSQTASGARFNPGAMTAAHRTLPFGTKVLVTNKSNGRTVVVTINDRGPFVRGRIIDLSTGAAGVIGMRGAGVAPVSVEVVGG
jgi:rare lipoprotein A